MAFPVFTKRYIMKIYTPEYYHHFHCIASACPDSCCKEWEVDVDDTSAAFYRGLEGPLGDRLRQVLKDTDDGTIMTIVDGRCPMWRQDGLCRIQAELGHSALCHVCQEFPRLRHDYGDFVECGLELSCPEAARLILSHSHNFNITEAVGGDVAEYDVEVMEILKESRSTVMNFLDSTTLDPRQTLAVLLFYSHEVQNWIDGGEAAVLNVDDCLLMAERYAAKGNWESLLDFFRNLEILTPQWRNRLSAPTGESYWHSQFFSLMRYFICRYWLQAVSDYDLICRVKFLIIACLVIYRLGGEFVETAQLFSKEIENDPDNLEAVLDGAYNAPALTDVHLLGLLLDY